MRRSRALCRYPVGADTPSGELRRCVPALHAGIRGANIQHPGWGGADFTSHTSASLIRPVVAAGIQNEYREIVSAFLDRMDVRVERRNSRIPLLMSDQFDNDAAVREKFYESRMGIDHRIETNDQSLGRQ